MRFQQLNQTADVVERTVDDDRRFFAAFPGGADNPGGAAEAVEVGNLVPHDINGGTVGQQIFEDVGHQTRLDFGALFDLVRHAAEKLKVDLAADDGLIAPAGKRHIHSQPGKVVEFGQRRAFPVLSVMAMPFGAVSFLT